ncbi:MAG: hypothetical protein LBR00_00290 [Clostridiales Family XIII bacterium]|jgi:signal transduction histidine kinase|nr:hypothetical protein [Clostridiales Family XIII bacterium]
MMSLCRFSPEALLCIETVLALAVCVQSVALIFVAARFEEKRLSPAVLFEGALLVQLVCSAVMTALTSIEMQAGVVYPVWAPARWLGLLPVAAGLLLLAERAQPRRAALDAVVCVALLIPILPFLPFATPDSDAFWIALFFVAQNFWFAFRAARRLHAASGVLRETISAFSFKDAADSMPLGILFATEHGKPLIENRVMTDLLARFGVRGAYDANHVWAAAASGWAEGDALSVTPLSGALLVRAEDGKSWLFSREEVLVKRELLVRFMAADVTEEDALNRELEEAGARLAAAGAALAAAMESIGEVEKQNAFLHMRIRLHDELGQRLSILNRWLENVPDGAPSSEVKNLLADLPGILLENDVSEEAYALSALAESFGLIGVAIKTDGVLPEGPAASVFVSVLREAATNAVRHGAAKTVRARFRTERGRYIMEIENDGETPEGALRAGTGLTGMQHRLARIGGTLRIETTPRFRIIAEAGVSV